MPRMNGYDAVRKLRSDGLDIPIIACTAHAMAGDEEKCIKAGCNGYISKPVDIKKLCHIMKKHLKPQPNKTT